MDPSHDSKRSPRITPARREALSNELAESGLSVVEFARRRGMRPATFYRGDANKVPPQIASAKREREARPLSFVEVSADAPERGSRPMIVRLGREVEAEVAAATQLDWVAQLNSKLREL